MSFSGLNEACHATSSFHFQTADVLSLKELKHKAYQLQERIVSEMTSHMDAILKAKNHVTNSLKGVRQYAETHD